MDTLSPELLEKIFRHCPLGDRFSLEMVNTRFRDCMPYRDIDQIIDIPYFEKITQRSIVRSKRGSGFLRSRDDFGNQRLKNEKFLLSILRCLASRVGDRFIGVRFGEMKPIVNNVQWPEFAIEWNVLSALLELNPKISVLDFGSRSVRIEALKILPSFKNLQHLSVSGVTNQFDSVLRQLRLISLKIGGRSATLNTADGSTLRQLSLEIPIPRQVSGVRRRNVLPQLFPNLEVLHVRPMDHNQFGDWLGPNTSVGSQHGFREIDHRVGYVNAFRNLRRSDLFGSFELNLPNMITFQATAVSRIQHLHVQLPPLSSLMWVLPIHQGIEDAAKQVISSWPTFFGYFKSIKSIKITCKKPHQDLQFGVTDLFYLGQLDNLRTLVLEEVVLKTDEAGEQFLEQMKSVKATPGMVFKKLEKLDIKLKKVQRSPPFSANQPQAIDIPAATETLLQLCYYTQFLRFVLSNCNRLKALKLNFISGLGWTSLNDYRERLGDACPLERLRIECTGTCDTITLPDLASVTWIRLKELDIWCYHDRLSVIAPQHKEWARTPMERIKGIGPAFPKLRRLRWPEYHLTPPLFNAILSEFGGLQEISMPLPYGFHITDFFDQIAEHPNLEVVKLGRQERMERERQETVKFIENEKEFEKLVRKRRAIMKEKGLRETELKVEKERMREVLGVPVM